MMEANDNRIVLVVDDSMLICKQIISALRDRGPLVSEAHNGDEALEMVRSLIDEMYTETGTFAIAEYIENR